jgi:DNA-binding Lrp family transcriptional regulator
VPAAGWVLGACWLWESKPEVWFTYYIHAAVWVFAGILLISARRAFARSASRVAERVKLLSKEGEIESFEADAEWRRLSGAHTIRGGIAGLLVLGLVGSLGISAYVAAEQAFTPPQKTSWSWSVYRSLVDCVDQDLMALEKRLGSPKDFRVWGPTFPDILIELSLRHPHWQFTRTNDFHARRPQAVEHGVKDVHAMVTTETLQPEESWLTGLQSEFPLIRSVWMTWDAYYLSEFLKIPDWMPHRRYCQRGRWRAFLYLKN